MDLQSRPYQIVVFGASGYTGKYVVQEFLNYPEIHLAVAGRSEEKLKNMLDNLSGNSSIKDRTGIIIADVNDKASLLAMCRQADILVSCVGPYRFYGKQVVEACIESETHYLDVSGEPQFLEETQLQYFEAAYEKKLYIIGSCGLDSLPCDLGVQVLKQQFPGFLYSVDTYLELSNEEGISGNFATWQSAIHGVAHASELKSIRRKLNHTLFKDYRSQDQELTCIVKKEKKKILFKSDDGKWCIPFPGSDKSVCIRTQRFTNIYETAELKSPVQVSTFMIMPSLLHALVTLFLGFIFFVLTRFQYGCRLLEKYPEFFSAGVFRKDLDPEEGSARSIHMIFNGLGWNNPKSCPPSTFKCQPNTRLARFFDSPVGPYKTTAICIAACAKTILDEHHSPTMPHFGVLTPGSAFLRTKLVNRLKIKGIIYS